MVVSSVVAATAFALLSLPSVSARLLSSLSELETATYDFVVVGGGNAGSVVANRLTENENFKVLVVEAGVNNEGLLGMEIPFLASSQFGTGVDWNFSTVPQPGVNDKSLHVAKGFALGGDTSLNIFLWYRGSNDIWDHYARLTGDDNWSWDSMAEYYKKTSRIVAPTNGRDISGDFIPDAHGDGPVQVTLNGVVWISITLFTTWPKKPRASSPSTKIIIPVNRSGSVTTGGGSRNSAATAYLQPAINRPNLDVIVNTYVTRLFSSTSDDGIPVMDTVQLASGTNGPFVNVTASKEIVLSAGSINSPKILMLSGIGPQEELSSFDIPVLVDSPAVGANMTEHPIVFNVYSLNSTSSYDDVLRLPALRKLFSVNGRVI
ncbi:hypothetical protein VNI00_003084 [Paramarasmius palmivorus]|uniref:Glucose-methanol-choline oxidoreductase N-terminal domain-containing protein n=1 Tax=Paramarasmius palmivorus TaxID=297713 RepID=A0AAW0DUG6_9AGAR